MSQIEDIAWAVGLYEGEGSASVNNRDRTPVVNLSTTDLDTIERFHRIVGVGRIGTYRPPLPRKPLYQWSVTKSDEIIQVLNLFIDSGYLGSRRLEQANKVLVRAREIKPHRNKRRDLALLVKLGLKEANV